MRKTLLFAVAILAFSVPLWAQPEEPQQTPQTTPTTPPNLGWPDSQTFSLFRPGTTSFRIDFGVQPVDVDTESSKFEEYRDIDDGAVLPFFAVSSGGAEDHWLITGEDIGQEDMRITAGLERGPWGLDVIYDEIPHNFGHEARTLLELTRHDYFQISDTLQRAFQSAIEARRAQSPASVNFTFLRDLVAPSFNAANTIDIGLIRQRGLFEVNYAGGWWGGTPGTVGGGPEAVGPGRSGITLSYFQENRHGDRQAGTSFGFGNVVETPEPIDYITRDIGLSAEMPLGNASLRGSIHLNQFENEILAHEFDNPFRVTDATDPNAYTAPGAGSIGGASRGLVALPPNSDALTGALSFLWRLPARSKLTADVQLGQWTQDDELFPFTTNTAIVTPDGHPATSLEALPVRNFDGEIQTFSGAVSFSTRPIEPLNVSARWRTYDMDNQSERVEFREGYVRFEGVWEEIPRITVPYSWTLNRGDVSVSYDFGFVDLEAGYQLDIRDRTFREVDQTTENTVRFSATTRPLSWMAVRATYEVGQREFDGEYDTEGSEHASYLEAEALAQLPELRRFDLANRDVNRLSALVQLTPFGNLGVTLQYLGTTEDYDDDSDFGLLEVDNQALTAEVDFTPAAPWSVYGFITLESYDQFQRGRQSGATPSRDPLADWTSDVEDDVNTIGFGGTYAFSPNLDFKLFTRMQEVESYNDLTSPPGGTPDVAFDIPEFDDTKLFNASAEFEYRLTDIWRLALGGWFEDYEIRDAQTSGTTNYMPGGFFLAPHDADYRGTVAYLRLSYRR